MVGHVPCEDIVEKGSRCLEDAGIQVGGMGGTYLSHNIILVACPRPGDVNSARGPFDDPLGRLHSQRFARRVFHPNAIAGPEWGTTWLVISSWRTE